MCGEVRWSWKRGRRCGSWWNYEFVLGDALMHDALAECFRTKNAMLSDRRGMRR